jgi:hypothetical protein
LLAWPIGCAFSGAGQLRPPAFHVDTPPVDANLVKPPSPYAPVTQIETPKEVAPAPPESARVETRVPDPPPVPPAPPPSLEPVTKVATTITPQPRPAPEAPLVNALRELLEQHPDRALELLKHTENASPKETLALLRAAALLGEGRERLDPREIAALLEQLDDCRARLRGQAPLTLHHLCFYRQVISYGNVDVLPNELGGPAFQAGVDGRAGERIKVYAEVHNFRLKEVRNPEDGRKLDGYETFLGGTLTIVDSCGGLVSEMDFQVKPDRYWSRIHDCYVTFDFHVPARTPPGSYSLKVKVRDVDPITREERTAECPIDFRVVGSKQTAGRGQ